MSCRSEVTSTQIKKKIFLLEAYVFISISIEFLYPCRPVRLLRPPRAVDPVARDEDDDEDEDEDRYEAEGDGDAGDLAALKGSNATNEVTDLNHKMVGRSENMVNISVGSIGI
jgi:hypothetical protein